MTPNFQIASAATGRKAAHRVGHRGRTYLTLNSLQMKATTVTESIIIIIMSTTTSSSSSSSVPCLTGRELTIGRFGH